jgi:hypothetical protein
VAFSALPDTPLSVRDAAMEKFVTGVYGGSGGAGAIGGGDAAPARGA